MALFAPSPSVSASSRLLALYEGNGNNDYIGEPVSILAHSEQAAEFMAAARPNDSEAICAALLHDIGHVLGMEAGEPMGTWRGRRAITATTAAELLTSPVSGMEGCGVPDHEARGGRFVASLGLPGRVSKLVAMHVAAKRYRVATDPSYADKLTDASKTTLRHQGGPMSEAECEAFREDPDREIILLMRTCDEKAKVVGASPPPFASYAAAIDELVAGPEARPWQLSESQTDAFARDGYVIVRRVLKQWPLAAMADEVTAMAAAAPSGLLVHHEKSMVDGAPLLCRVENYAAFHDGWSQVVHELVAKLVEQAYGEEVAFFKEKLNFKAPGGAGFRPHQDASAYATGELASHHVSVLVAIDPATKANGCLEIAPARHKQGLHENAKGVLTETALASMDFVDVLLEPGDLVLFDSFAPHRSAANTSQAQRRAAYITFNRKSEGDFHDVYYAKKMAVMGEKMISINDDFAGTILTHDEVAAATTGGG